MNVSNIRKAHIAFGKWKGKKGKNEIKSLLTISIIHFFLIEKRFVLKTHSKLHLSDLAASERYLDVSYSRYFFQGSSSRVLIFRFLSYPMRFFHLLFMYNLVSNCQALHILLTKIS